MPGHGYQRLTLNGFAGFGLDLADAHWSGIVMPGGWDQGPLDLAAMQSLPLTTQWKLRLSRAVTAAGVVVAEERPLAALDTAWDNAQRRLALQVEFADYAPDATHKEAAARVRAALLRSVGFGRAVTSLAYHQQVDYGRAQMALARNPAVVADVVTLGLEPLLDAIAHATEALAEGLGRAVGFTPLATRKAAQRSARDLCVRAFNLVHADMAWVLENTGPGDERAQVTALLGTLQALLARNPAVPVPPPVDPAVPTG